MQNTKPCLVMQAEAALLLERSASQKARQWTITTPLLLAAGALAGTSAGCLATLSGIGGPPSYSCMSCWPSQRYSLSRIKPRTRQLYMGCSHQWRGWSSCAVLGAYQDPLLLGFILQAPYLYSAADMLH